MPTTKRGPARVGLVPFKDDTPEHYRGWAPIKVSFTDEGREALGLSVTNSTVMYWGGPALVAGEAVPNSDVKVWGKYAGQLINTCSSKPVKEMAGKAQHHHHLRHLELGGRGRILQRTLQNSRQYNNRWQCFPHLLR